MSEHSGAVCGYFLMCSGLGSVYGAFGFPYSFPGFFLPEMYIPGVAMLLGGFALMRLPVRA